MESWKLFTSTWMIVCVLGSRLVLISNMTFSFRVEFDFKMTELSVAASFIVSIVSTIHKFGMSEDKNKYMYEANSIAVY